MGEILSNVGPPPRHSPSNTPAFSSVSPSFSKGVFICRPAVPQQSGERTRLACWFRRLAETNFGKNRAEGKRPYEEKFARASRPRPHATRVRSPEPPTHHHSFRAPALAAIFPHQLHRFIDHFRSDVERGTEADRVLTGAKSQHTKIEEAVPKFFARFRIGKIEREKYSAAARSGNQRFFRLQIAQLIEEIGSNFRGVLNQTFLLDDAQTMGRAHHIGEVSTPG